MSKPKKLPRPGRAFAVSPLVAIALPEGREACTATYNWGALAMQPGVEDTFFIVTARWFKTRADASKYARKKLKHYAIARGWNL